MKILKADAGMLTDFEVLEMLRARGAKSDPMSCVGLVSFSECKVFDCLIQRPACNQTREVIESFKRRCDEFKNENEECKFTKAEILNVINFRPTDQAEIYAIISNIDTRFEVNEDGSSDEIDQLFNIVCEILPPPPKKPEQEASGAMEQN